jgi:hypothetical protein
MCRDPCRIKYCSYVQQILLPLTITLSPDREFNHQRENLVGQPEEEVVVRSLRVQGDQGGEDEERVVAEPRGRNLLHSGKQNIRLTAH